MHAASTNVVHVSFERRRAVPAAGARCATCPVRACCTCTHWLNEGAGCTTGACLADHRLPSTRPQDRCGDWKPRPIALVR
ncbi:MAG: hypothetical protein ACOCYE_09320 [Pseudomonadota bacterium]